MLAQHTPFDFMGMFLNTWTEAAAGEGEKKGNQESCGMCLCSLLSYVALLFKLLYVTHLAMLSRYR